MSHHFRAFTVFCLFWAVLSVLRVYITGTTEYLGFVWNLILALLPYFFAGLAVERTGWMRWMSFVLWFVFFPNSLYIFTDYIHLPEYPEMLHFDIVYISVMAIAGLFAGFASLEIVHSFWNKQVHQRLAWMLVSLTIIIGTFWVYIGRFLRFNSWDILSHPLHILQEIWVMILSDGRSLMITDPARSLESIKYSGGTIELSIFLMLYFGLFMLLYVFVYHTRRVR
jgi:uncharacterized membrane protein